MGRRLKLGLLWSVRLVGGFALSRALTARQVRILCYHGGAIGDESGFKPLLFCSKQTLQRRVQWLTAKGFEPITLDQAVRLLQQSPAQRQSTWQPRLPVVLTFDDGWFSTFDQLLPVLKQARIPSTLYLCTQLYESGYPNLPVTLRYLAWCVRREFAADQPAALHLYGFDPRFDGNYNLRDVRDLDLLCDGVQAWLETSKPNRDQVLQVLTRLAKAMGLPEGVLDADSRRFEFMTRDEVHKLRDMQCSLQLHGHEHRYPVGKPDALRADIERCRDTILGLGLPDPQHYCYPSGEYDDDSARVLASRQVTSATTCVPGLLKRADAVDRYYLNRFLDGESVHNLEFESEMSGFSDLLRWGQKYVRRATTLARWLRGKLRPATAPATPDGVQQR